MPLDNSANYLKYASICSNTDYSNNSSVKKHNNAVSNMYKIVEQATSSPSLLSDLISLLDNPVCSKWLAHQLVEKVDLTKEIKSKCFSIVEDLMISGNEIETYGHKLWLEEWKKQ